MHACMQHDCDSDSDGGFSDDLGGSGWDYEEAEEIEVGAEEEAALAAFMAPGAADHRQRTLSDIILQKIREKQQEQGLTEIPE